MYNSRIHGQGLTGSFSIYLRERLHLYDVFDQLNVICSSVCRGRLQGSSTNLHVDINKVEQYYFLKKSRPTPKQGKHHLKLNESLIIDSMKP